MEDPSRLSYAQPRSSRREFFKLFPSIALPIFMAIGDQTIVATALPAIGATFGEAERLSLVIVAYLVATCITAPVYGRLGDILGRKRLLLVALAVFVSGSVLCSLSQNFAMLVGARVLQGAGGGGLMTLAQALVGETVPARERARYQGYLSTVAVVSSVFGPVSGGFLTDYFGWRSVFLVNLPLGLCATLLALRLVTRHGTAEEFRFDSIGLLLFAVFISSTVLMLKGVQGLLIGAWILPLILGGVALSALILLVWREKRAAWPLFSIALLRQPAIWRCDALAACHGAILIGLVTFLPFYLRMVHGTSASSTGVLLLPMTAGIGLGSIVTGRIVARTGQTAIFPSMGLTIATVGLMGVAFASPSLSEGQMALTLGGLSLAIGSVMGVVQLTVQIAAGPQKLGAGSALVQLSRSLGAAIGTALIGTVLFLTFATAGPEASGAFARILQEGPDAALTLGAAQQAAVAARLEDAFRNAFLCVSAFAALAALMAWSLPIRRISAAE